MNLNQAWLVVILTKSTRADQVLLSIRMQKKINEGPSVDYTCRYSVVNDLRLQCVMCVNISLQGGRGGGCVLSPDEAELKGNINLRVPSSSSSSSFPPDYPPRSAGLLSLQISVRGDWTYISFLILLLLIW